MRRTLNTGNLEDYELFLRIKSLPQYEFQGHTAVFPDEYADRLGLEQVRTRDVSYEPLPGLYDYQEAIVRMAITKRKFCVFADCGLGKTLIFLEFARHAAEQIGDRRCVLIVSPLMVIKQTLAECKRFYGDSLPIEQVRAAGLKEWLERDTGCVAPDAGRIGITNYEAMTDDIHKGRLGALVCDECFAPDTPVDAIVDGERVEVPIAKICVGDIIENVFGDDRVVKTFRREVPYAVEVALDDGRTILSSPHHKFRVRDAQWVAANDLKPGDELVRLREPLNNTVTSAMALPLCDPRIRRYLDDDGKLYFYDLQAENDPSYSVGGCLVHNSSVFKSHYGKWGQKCLELGTGLEWKMACTGTPAPNDRIEYANHAVFMDAYPTVNSFLAKFFVNRGQTDNRWELKAHAIKPFYRALSHWSIFLTNPATYGWHDQSEPLPPIETHFHHVDMTPEQQNLVYHHTGSLFCDRIGGITSRSVLSQIAKGNYKNKYIPTNKPGFIRTLIDGWPEESTIIWCLYNKEQEILEREFPDAASLKGSTPYEHREAMIDDFKAGRRKVMISKPKILGFGLNLQVCTRQVFSGLQDSYESFYQAVKRSNRIGSEFPLNVHIPMTDIEFPMIQTVMDKASRVRSDAEEQEKLFREHATE